MNFSPLNIFGAIRLWKQSTRTESSSTGVAWAWLTTEQ